MPKVSKEIWEVSGIQLPVFIYREKRYNNRISITRKGVNLRVPYVGARILKDSYRKWAYAWLEKQVQERPDLIARFSPKNYQTGYEIETPYKTYTLELNRSERSTSRGKLNGHILSLDLNQNLSDPEVAKAVRTLCSRLIGKDQLPRVKKRIEEINEQCFQQEINAVRIKNNSSNWGSCSNSGNINISTKTLLAPYTIQDYIFVHELAHRIEMNHSDRYWAVVERAMPGYQKCEDWIKKNGHLCEI